MQNLLFLHVLRHYFDEFFCSIIDISEELTTRSVHVTTSAEDFAGENVDRSITLTAEGDLRFDLRAIGIGNLVGRYLVLAHKDGVVYILDLQGHIHYTFHIARLGVEAVHLAAVESDEGCMVLGEELHLMIQAVSHQLHALSRPCVEHTVVDGILVDAGGEEDGNDVVHLRMTGVVGEIAGVGHHAGIDAGSKILRQNPDKTPILSYVLRLRELVREAENEFAGGSGIRVGYLLGVFVADLGEVMVEN